MNRQPQIGDIAYHIRCTTCRYGKNYGAGKSAADRAATRHVQSKPHHVMVLTRETTIAIMSGVDGVDTLV